MGQSLPATPSLITTPVNENARVVLRGNVSPLIRGGRDLGPAPASARADRLMLLLKRSPAQDAALTAYLKDVQNPASSQYRKFLTPEEFGAQFGISDADLTIVEHWLQRHGFTVAEVNKGRTAIEFSGTVGQIQETFQTAIHRFDVAGVEHWANIADPQIPAALAPVIGGVASLNDFKPVGNIVKGPALRWDSRLRRYTPDLTVTIGGSQYLLLGPGDAATIYDSPNSKNTHLASGQAVYDGTGVTIGVAGTTVLDASGVVWYQQLFGLSSQIIDIYDGNTSNFDQSADETEALADVEISGALAPGATIHYYAAGDTAFQSGLFLAIYRAIDDNNINILSISYGACEAELGASGNLQVLSAWEQAAAQGITVVVASGDSGSAGCDDQNTETAASQGFGVNGLASTPYNIAVGGTDFDTLSNHFTQYVQSSGSSLTTALSYIPEEPWNDSTTTNGALSSNSPLSNSSGQTSIWAGGGGASNAANGSAGYSKPDWQRNFSPSNADTLRDLPDVSLFSGVAHYYAAWALCENNDCVPPNFTIHGVGGTSTSAPAFAGILAMVNQKLGASTRLGQANWVLYKLAQTAPSVFHAITMGNNSVYCTAGSPNCGANHFMNGYNAQSNYSIATGLGSVDATLLADHWSDDSRAATTTSLSLDKTTFTHGTPVTFTIGVNPSSATGNIAITYSYASQTGASGGTSTPFFPLSGGSASGTFSELPGGKYNVFANYAGDGANSGSISQPVPVTVTPEDSSVQLSVSYLNSSGQLVNASDATIPLGTLLSLNAMPIGISQSGNSHPITNATGTVSFYDPSPANTLSWGDKGTLDSTGVAEINTRTFFAGAHSVIANYSGDLSYNASTANPVTFTISEAPTTISATASESNTIGEPLTIEAYVAASIPANTVWAGGPVTFTDTTNNTVLGQGNASGGCPGTHTNMCSLAFVQINSTQLVSGANNIVATYAGNANFVGSGPSAPIAVTCNASCWNQFGQRLELSFYNVSSGTISAGGTITATVSVWQAGGFTGDVNLTCTVTGKNSTDQHVPTCGFNPTKVTVTANAGESTLTINTTGSATGSIAPGSNPGLQVGSAGVALCALLLLFFPAKRRGRSYFILLFAVLLAFGGISACGGGGSSSGGTTGGGGGGGTTSSGTTPDTYTVTFRAADVATGTVTAQDYVTFTVN